jgi:hypothetical protein
LFPKINISFQQTSVIIRKLLSQECNYYRDLLSAAAVATSKDSDSQSKSHNKTSNIESTVILDNIITYEENDSELV